MPIGVAAVASPQPARAVANSAQMAALHLSEQSLSLVKSRRVAGICQCWLKQCVILRQHFFSINE